MDSERFAHLRPSWVAFGWFIAAAVSALVLLGLIALGVLGASSGAPEGDVWVAVALLIGFITGGFFAGARVGRAPVLHGLGIGLFSLLVWLLANLLIPDPGDAGAWHALPLTVAAGLLLLQTVAAIVGARMGRRWTRGAESVG